jgi:hypothetical protein
MVDFAKIALALFMPLGFSITSSGVTSAVTSAISGVASKLAVVLSGSVTVVVSRLKS